MKIIPDGGILKMFAKHSTNRWVYGIAATLPVLFVSMPIAIAQDADSEALDEVDDVGTYVELELVVEESERKSATALVGDLAAHLGLTQSERRGYVELLLEGISKL